MKRVLTIISLTINSSFLVLCSISAFNILLSALQPEKRSAIGIIGGEDGPTAIFYSSDFGNLGPIAIILLFCILLLFEITFILSLRSSKTNN